jgi:hypothetical protein
VKAPFLRKRKMARGVLVLDSSLAGLEPHLKRKNYRIVKLPVGTIDAERKALVLTERTLVTKTPQAYEDDVPVLEYSVIDASRVTSDDVTLADIISRAWTRYRLRSEGWFILRVRENSDHKIEFPE